MWEKYASNTVEVAIKEQEHVSHQLKIPKGSLKKLYMRVRIETFL